MKLKINKACDLGSISVLPPRRTGGSASGGMSSSASAAAGAVASQQRSQTLSQQSFSQGGGGASLLHSQSQLSQASLDENLLGLHLPYPARDQRFGLHDDSSKRVPSLPASSTSCVRDESQLQLAKVSSNPIHRWNPSLPDSRCQVPNEDVERKFQHLASSVHKMGMVLDSVQGDVMQLNRDMKEASLDSGSIRHKVVLLENSLQQILKGQDDLKALLEGGTKSNPDQLSVLNSHTSKLNEISSTLSVWPKQVQADLRQLQGDIFRTFTKEMEGIVRAIRSLNSRPAAMQMLADQNCTTNERPLRNQIPVANGKPLMNQTPVANGRPPQKNQIPVANGRPLMCQTPVANGMPQMNQKPVANGRPLMSQTPEANGRSQMNQAPVANGRPLMNQIPVANGRPLMSQTPEANGRSQMNQAPVANGRPLMKQIPVAKVVPAPLVYPAKVADPTPKMEQGKVKTAPQKLVGSSYRLAPKQEEGANRKANPQVATKKAPVRVSIIIDSDDDSEGRASCVVLKTGPDAAADKAKGCQSMREGTDTEEEGLQILRRARKRRRRETQTQSGPLCSPKVITV